MSEREKMLAGELYLASDPELVEMRRAVRHLVKRYNDTQEEDEKARTTLLMQIFGRIGAGAFVEPPLFVDYGAHIEIGDQFFANTGLCVLDCAHVRFGDRVMVGPNVQVYAATHPLEARVRAEGPELAAPITVGNDVWIGGGVILLPGVTIGDRCVIGAGSVVTKNIPADAVAAGNPCRVIRKLHAPS